MNIKKMTAAIFTLIAVLLIIGAGTVFFITSRDEITNTDISEFADNNLRVKNVLYTTEKGGSAELSANCGISALGDGESGMYRIRITLNRKENKSYGLENLSAAVDFGSRDTIISGYCSGGGGVYSETPIPSYVELKAAQRVTCDFEGDYAYMDFIIQSDTPHEIPVKFTYDISGNGLNFLNGFPDQSFETSIPEVIK